VKYVQNIVSVIEYLMIVLFLAMKLKFEIAMMTWMSALPSLQQRISTLHSRSVGYKKRFSVVSQRRVGRSSFNRPRRRHPRFNAHLKCAMHKGALSISTLPAIDRSSELGTRPCRTTQQVRAAVILVSVWMTVNGCDTTDV